ncbi:alkaline phosphatase-like isoform X1 [Chironomus tepperi]|uniref:alkaline phosphatase-like isoform X1 n=1 Tax=Chironomus tepperi TaxID=113505 RepID=UPI00391FC983
MKLLILILFISTGCLAYPKVNPYVESQNEDRFSDFDMHPHVHRQHTSKIEGFAFKEEELTSEYWMNNAKALVEEKVKRTLNTNKARNVIMFLGDGMSHYSLAAARLLLGGEDAKLSFETFPYTASSMTYCVDVQVADSACTATAYLSGVKTNDGEIGVNANATYENCYDGLNKANHVDSIAAWFQKANRSSGIVTTTRITHATPAGAYAHTTSRDWEDDAKVQESGCSATDNDDIAEQLVFGETGKNLKVILGGGSRHFIGKSLTEHNTAGRRLDEKNLIYEWEKMDSNRTFVRNRAQLMGLNPKDVKQLFGLFNGDHLSYWIDVQRDGTQDTMPSLTDMTTKAIDILELEKDGYFLLVEGGRIDHGHHRTQAKHAVTEAVEFSRAIEAALKKVNLEETLIVVTADHGHVMTMSGYADRGGDIFGIAGKATDDKPYMTLSYANGESFPQHSVAGERVDPSKLNGYIRNLNDLKFPATVPREDETHGGEDVGIWSIGPWSHLFQGTLEQNVIAHIMAYASCVGDGIKACDNL